MKTIKIIILLATISLFTSVPYDAAKAARDCSDPKGFHEKMMCTLSGSTSSSAKEAKEGDTTASWIKKFFGKKNNKVTGN